MLKLLNVKKDRKSLSFIAAILHSSNKPSELTQWFCHDDSTINIVLDNIIIIIQVGGAIIHNHCFIIVYFAEAATY